MMGAETAASSTSQPPVYSYGAADITNSTVLTPSASSSENLATEPDISLHKGMNEAGFALGASIGVKIFGGVQRHDFALQRIYYGRVVTDDFGENSWYCGDLEIFGEAIGGEQFKPTAASFGGATLVFRYNFDTRTRWVPFYDIGAGATATGIGAPDLTGTFEFNLQTGPGVRWMINKDTALTLQARYLHLSNAGIADPNQGVNTFSFYVGMSWLF